ncbi:MAG: bifunctional ornithine acetyltransferase/N-acetylglutamate synthase [Planctomycetes bacterium]|nr:bifunctional ornithine acetyltransferase/N-acetylglutamate synthase [Planctomycetota bacterium]
MASTDMRFSSRDEHRSWLSAQARLPVGFRVGAAGFGFTPVEVSKPARMTATVIALDRPTEAFAALFTKNAFPGAPVIIGRSRLSEDTLGAIVINNKISNVCAPDGVGTSERICAAAASALGIESRQVLPSSTGVIGWRLPEAALVQALPQTVAALQSESVLPAADGIVTTDLYAKIRRVDLAGGSIVGIAKGAGMIEPNLATMLVYLLTDLDVPREALRASLQHAAAMSFNCMSIDGDTSTSDTVVALSSRAVACPDLLAFQRALDQVCVDLSEDIARNGEGVHHVIRVAVTGAPGIEVARGIGKSVVNSPLFQCAVCGNDPNVGRLVMAIGKFVGEEFPGVDLSRAVLTMGGRRIFADGRFILDHETEAALVAHLRSAELYASTPPADGLTFRPPIGYPPHERCVEIGIDLDAGGASCVVIGTDRSHEYISENADYRS